MKTRTDEFYTRTRVNCMGYKTLATAALLCLAMMGGVPAAWAIPLRPLVKGITGLADELVEMGMKVSGRNLDDAARMAARKSVERGIKAHGDDVLRGLLKKGGVELAEAAARNGDDVWRFARAVPGASRLLAVHADELVPLTRRFGTKLLEIEAISAGSGRALVRLLGEPAAAHILKTASPKAAVKLAMLAEHASPKARALLIESYLKTRNRERFVKMLLKNSWKPILAGGLSIAAITAAHEVADGLQTSVIHDPETAVAVANHAILPISIALAGLLLLAGTLLCLKYIPSRRRGRASPGGRASTRAVSRLGRRPCPLEGERPREP